jgi:hypothetical protein
MPALAKDLDWDYFFLDGFSWTDLLEFLGIPHYSNDDREDQAPLLFEIRTVAVKYPDLDETDKQQLLVIWRPETSRPTDKMIDEACSNE